MQTVEDSNEKFIHTLCDIGGLIECRNNEIKYQKPKFENEADETKLAIKEMLVENTGCSILDSGSAYGRGWERNRLRNFDNEDPVILRVYDDSYDVQYNVYHYLINFLELDDKCKEYQKILDAFITRESTSYLADMEDFLDYMRDKYEDEDGNAADTVYNVENTYNYENIISQVLQYGIFEINCYWYIILQIHNGCDLRGGYTKPRIFCLETDDNFGYFMQAQTSLTCICDRCQMVWDSYDCGFEWEYVDRNSTSESLSDNVDTELKLKFDSKNNKLYHENCGGEIKFDVIQSW